MKTWRTSWAWRSNKAGILAVLGVVALAAALLSLLLGAEALDPAAVWTDLTAGRTDSATVRIFLYIRLPRTCACLLAGAALATAGTIVQGVLANSLAAPSTIGVNSGAGLAVAICCAVAPEAAAATPWAAMAGAFGGVLLVLYIARRTGASKITLVLAGVAVSSIFSAGVDLVVTLVPEALNGYSDFRIGGFSGVSMSQITPALRPILIGLAAAFLLHSEMDVLLLGTEQAQALGLRAKRLRLMLLAVAALLAGAAVSFSGLLGFVGLIVPHMMRRVVGEESGPLLAASALGGAGLLCLCDLLARLVLAPYEIPVGIVMSLAGGPFFLWLLGRRGVHGRD